MKMSPYSYPGIDPKVRSKFKTKQRFSITPWDILKIIADESDATVSELISRKRHRHLVDSRQLFCFIMRDRFGMTYSTIGGFLDRDHATAIHGVNAHMDKFQFDRTYFEIAERVFDRVDSEIKRWS
jgi:chromosomal replication initiation ATPase DnaA